MARRLGTALRVVTLVCFACTPAVAQEQPEAVASTEETAAADASTGTGSEDLAYEPGPLSIYIFGESPEPLEKGERKRLKKERKQVREAAKDAWKKLKKELESRHGKRTSDWPVEAMEAFDDAADREALAALEYHLLEMKPTEVPDSVENMRRYLAAAIEGDAFDTFVEPRLVDSREEAHISIEMLTRRSRLGPAWHLYLKVIPERWLPEAKLAEMTLQRVEESATENLWMLTEYGEQGPFWIVEAELRGGAGGWRGVAAVAISNLVKRLDLALQELDGDEADE